MPDTGLSTDSSAADTSGTSESSPGSSSTMGTDETTDTASNETSGSSSSSNGSTESDSTPSVPPSPRRTSMPCTEEAMSAKVPSGPPSPSLSDSSLEVRQILRDQAGHALTHSQYQKQTNAAKQRATVLKQVAQLDIKQLPLPEPGEPLQDHQGNPMVPGCVKGKQRERVQQHPVMKSNHHNPEERSPMDQKDSETVKLCPFRRKRERSTHMNCKKPNSVLK